STCLKNKTVRSINDAAPAELYGQVGTVAAKKNQFRISNPFNNIHYYILKCDPIPSGDEG
ncbi:hypothetical protein TNCV_4782451, partial [Trichonephila clavipes]